MLLNLRHERGAEMHRRELLVAVGTGLAMVALPIGVSSANHVKIDADNIEGQIHQSKDVKVGDTKGEIKAPEVTASVIYAEEISANSVVAQNVYVRDLRRR